MPDPDPDPALNSTQPHPELAVYYSFTKDAYAMGVVVGYNSGVERANSLALILGIGSLLFAFSLTNTLFNGTIIG